MKNWKKLALCAMVGTILLLPNEVNAASMSFSDMTVKGAFLIISLVVILLLLYLGYRMDSNESIPKEKKSKKKEFVDSKDNYVKKQPVEAYVPNDTVYEEDSREYEVDNVNPEEISESVEYEEDTIYQPEEDFEDINTITSNIEPEKSLYEASSSDFGETISFDSSALNKELNTVSDIEEIVEEDEEFGEEFDTSIIDNIDNDFEDEVFATAIPKTTTTVEEEIVEEVIEDEEFGEEFDTSIIDEIDDDFEDIQSGTFSSKTVEPVVEEESDFPGFSVGTPKSETVTVNDFVNTFDEIDELDDLEEVEEIPVVEKPKKRYTKVSTKKVEPTISTELDEDFMRQMEANLGDGAVKEIKPAKKTSTRKKKTE